MYNAYDFIYDGKSSISENIKMLYTEPNPFEFTKSIPDKEINTFHTNQSSKWHISGITIPEPLSFQMQIMMYSDDIDLYADGNPLIQRNRISRISHWLFDQTQFKKLQILTDDMRDMYFMAIFKDVEYFEAGGDVCGFRATVLCDTIGAYEEKKISKSCTGNTTFSIQCLHDGIYEIFPTYKIKSNTTSSRDIVYARDNYGHEWKYYGYDTVNTTNRYIMLTKNIKITGYDKLVDIAHDYRRYSMRKMKVTAVDGNTITVVDDKGNRKQYEGSGVKVNDVHDYLVRYDDGQSPDNYLIEVQADDTTQFYFINCTVAEVKDGTVKIGNGGHYWYYKGTAEVGTVQRYIIAKSTKASDRNYNDEVTGILAESAAIYIKDGNYMCGDKVLGEVANDTALYFLPMTVTQSIKNATDVTVSVNNNPIKLQSITAGSTVTIDTEKLIAKSDQHDNLYVGNRFNNGFPPLVYGKNTIEVNGSCQLDIEYKLIREVGC